jgi:serine protease Do
MRWLLSFAATLLAMTVMTVELPAQTQPDPDRDAAARLHVLGDAFLDLVAQVEPAVVQVFATTYGPVSETSGQLVLSRQRMSGSGVIVDPNGLIITNAHVVHDARRVQVLLPLATAARDEHGSILKPKGELLGAQVIGVDLETDLAVLRIRRDGLPHLQFADSDLLRKGQFVLAFGSPMGLESSVSMGVVSSTARQLRPEDPMIYLQTDAAINPGNSGGPLVDLQGKLVGVNTMILTQSGGSEGLGFAAPSNIVANVFRQIRDTGRVQRGSIGVYAQSLNPFLARGLKLPRNWGVLIGDVYPGGPADKAGLRAGDVVLTLNGKVMENGRQLRINLYGMEPGKKVQLEILRDGQTRRIDVEVFDRPGDPGRIAALAHPEDNLVPRLGILGLTLDAQVSGFLPSLRTDTGVVVAAVLSEVPAWGDGFAPGDVIHSINGTRVRDLDTVRQVLRGLQPGDAAVVHLERGGQMQYLALEIED